jgi:hypothetical protein
MGWWQKIYSPACCPQGSTVFPRHNLSDLLVSARATTVNVEMVSSGRNCRETIASLRNARVTRYHVTNFLCFLGTQWLRWQRYYIRAWIISEC